MAGAIACALIAYLTYKFFLSQRDNYFSLYILVACALFLDHFYAEKKRKTFRGYGLKSLDTDVNIAPRGNRVDEARQS